jgi:FecR protein
MKLAKQTLTWLVAGVVTLALVASAEAQTSKLRTGKVVRIKGAARYSTGNNIWQPLKVGAILRSGAIVQTAQDSYADVVLNEESSAPAASGGMPGKAPGVSSAVTPPPSPAAAAARSVDQDVLRILEDTVVSFDRLTAVDTGADRVTETELDLRTGAIFGAVKKQAAASRFEIKIPNGVAGIRGTYFYASARGIFACLNGSLVVAYTAPDGAPGAQVLVGGYQFNCLTRELSPLPSSFLSQLNQLLNDMLSLTSTAATAARGGLTEREVDQTVFPVSRATP